MFKCAKCGKTYQTATAANAHRARRGHRCYPEGQAPKATLIQAVSPLTRLEDFSLCLILCVHMEDVDPQDAVTAAFREWAQTEKGRDFIDGNGSNWGDSLDIPDEILERHGIYKYEGLLGGGELRGAKYQHEITVDHNESLVDQDIPV
jgi:hypothetical protein